MKKSLLILAAIALAIPVSAQVAETTELKADVDYNQYGQKVESTPVQPLLQGGLEGVENINYLQAIKRVIGMTDKPLANE